MPAGVGYATPTLDHGALLSSTQMAPAHKRRKKQRKRPNGRKVVIAKKTRSLLTR